MSALRSRRVTALLTIGALSAGTAIAATPAQGAGLLGGILPNVGGIVTQTGQTLGGLVPGAGGVVTGVTGAVGGVIGGVQDTVSGAVDQTLGSVIGSGSGALPDDVLGSLLSTLLANSAAAPGTPGFGGPGGGGPIVFSGAQNGLNGITLDASAPRPTVKVLSRLKQVGTSGRMRIEIATNEPGVVAVAGRVRPGAAVRAKQGAKPIKVSRKLIKIPQIVLGYRQAGKLIVTVRLSRAAQRALGRSKTAKMSVGTIGIDVYKNQGADNARLNLKR